MKQIDAIFFDFDGVILESMNIKGWAFEKLFEKYPEHIEKIVEFHHIFPAQARRMKPPAFGQRLDYI